MPECIFEKGYVINNFLYHFSIRFEYMSTALGQDFKIEKASPELKLKAIKTLPMDPYETHLYLFANGTRNSLRAHFDSDEKKKYVSECINNKVMPFTGIKIGYDLNDNILIGKPTGGEIEDLLRGGRFQQVLLETRQERAFKKFKDTLLNGIIESGYHVGNGFIHFASEEKPIHSIVIDEDLKLLTNANSRGIDKIMSWFKGLSEK